MSQSRRSSELSTNSNTESQADLIERHRVATNERIDLHQQGIAGWSARWERMQEHSANQRMEVEARLQIENHRIDQSREKKAKSSNSTWKLPSIGGSWVFGQSRETKIGSIKKWESRKKQDKEQMEPTWIPESNWKPFGKKKDTPKESKLNVAERLRREDRERQMIKESEKEKEATKIKERELKRAEYLASENLMRALMMKEEMIKQANNMNRGQITRSSKTKINKNIQNSCIEHYYSSIDEYEDKNAKKPSKPTYSDFSGEWNGPVTLFKGFEKEEDVKANENKVNVFEKYDKQLQERRDEGMKHKGIINNNETRTQGKNRNKTGNHRN
ncbi:hypothetical protein QTP88_029956 [Uroleucon formosanum]